MEIHFGKRLKLFKVDQLENNHTDNPESISSFRYEKNENVEMSKSEPNNGFSPSKKIKKAISSRLSKMSATFKNDLIRDFYMDKRKKCDRFLFFCKYFIFPNIISYIFGVLFIMFIKSLAHESCYLPPDCICTEIKPKVISVFKELITTWLIWFILLLMNCRYSLFYRIVISFWSLVFIFMYYLFFPNERNFIRYPIYASSLVSNALGTFIYTSSKSFKNKMIDVYNTNGFYVVMLTNYVLLIFVKQFKNLIGIVAFTIIYNLYIFVFFDSMQKSLIKYGRFLCEKNEILNPNDKFFFALNSRISLCFLFSFLAAPFLNFSSNNSDKYGLIFSYSHSILALYTRINLMNKYLKRFFNFLFAKLKINFQLSQKIDETEIYLSKKISGSCIDIIFIANTSILTFYFWKKTVAYSDCETYALENYKYFGITIFSLINLVMTCMLLYFIIKKKITLFSYPIWTNALLNIIILFLSRCLFESIVINNFEKLGV